MTSWSICSRVMVAYAPRSYSSTQGCQALSQRHAVPEVLMDRGGQLTRGQRPGHGLRGQGDEGIAGALDHGLRAHRADAPQRGGVLQRAGGLIERHGTMIVLRSPRWRAHYGPACHCGTCRKAASDADCLPPCGAAGQPRPARHLCCRRLPRQRQSVSHARLRLAGHSGHADRGFQLVPTGSYQSMHANHLILHGGPPFGAGQQWRTERVNLRGRPVAAGAGGYREPGTRA